jgi:hypothetical protein
MDEREIRASGAGDDSTPVEGGDDEGAAFTLPSWLDEAIARSQRSEPPTSGPGSEPAPDHAAFSDPSVPDFLADNHTLEPADQRAFEPRPSSPEPEGTFSGRSDAMSPEASPSSWLVMDESGTRAWLADEASRELTPPPPDDASSSLERSRPVDADRPLLGDGTSLPSFLPHHRGELPRSLRASEEIPAKSGAPQLLLVAALILAASAAVLFVKTQLDKNSNPDVTSAAAPMSAEPPPAATTPVPTPPAAEPAAEPASGPTAADQPANVDQPPSPEAPPQVERSTSGHGRFGISVGTFRSEERATIERTRLAANSGLVPKTVVMSEGGESLYRLILGAFDSRESADSAASSLVQRGIVKEAFAVPLGAAPSKPR